jgi:hypothetical protein
MKILVIFFQKRNPRRFNLTEDDIIAEGVFPLPAY